MEENENFGIDRRNPDRQFDLRRTIDTCPNHERMLNTVEKLATRVNDTEIKVNSVSSNMALLIKILAGTVVIASAMLGSIYLSVAKIDKQVATIVTNVHESNKNVDKMDLQITTLQEKTHQLEMNCQQLKSQIEYSK